MVNVVAAFKSQRTFGFRTASVLSVNKLDGIIIAGDLTPLSNNLLIKVKEAMTSTAGWYLSSGKTIHFSRNVVT